MVFLPMIYGLILHGLTDQITYNTVRKKIILQHKHNLEGSIFKLVLKKMCQTIHKQMLAL